MGKTPEVYRREKLNTFLGTAQAILSTPSLVGAVREGISRYGSNPDVELGSIERFLQAGSVSDIFCGQYSGAGSAVFAIVEDVFNRNVPIDQLMVPEYLSTAVLETYNRLYSYS